MTDVEPVVNNFASSARAGRRNAVPDIQGSTAAGGTLEELPVKLEALSVKEGNTQNPLRVSGSYLFHDERQSIFPDCRQLVCLIAVSYPVLADVGLEVRHYGRRRTAEETV